MSDIQVESLKIKVDLAAERLLSQAETLRSCADRLISKIQNKQLNIINSLGEIQGLGSQVDVGCMELRTLLNILEDLEKEDKS